jgi:hypothetical protein
MLETRLPQNSRLARAATLGFSDRRRSDQSPGRNCRNTNRHLLVQILLEYPQKEHRQAFSVWSQSIFSRQAGQAFFLADGGLLDGDTPFFDFWISLEDGDDKGTAGGGDGSKIGIEAGVGLGAFGCSLFSSLLPRDSSVVDSSYAQV